MRSKYKHILSVFLYLSRPFFSLSHLCLSRLIPLAPLLVDTSELRWSTLLLQLLVYFHQYRGWRTTWSFKMIILLSAAKLWLFSRWPQYYPLSFPWFIYTLIFYCPDLVSFWSSFMQFWFIFTSVFSSVSVLVQFLFSSSPVLEQLYFSVVLGENWPQKYKTYISYRREAQGLYTSDYPSTALWFVTNLN